MTRMPDHVRLPVRITCFGCGALWSHHCLCHVLYGNGYLVEYAEGPDGYLGISDPASASGGNDG
jgi:hypothetical protein